MEKYFNLYSNCKVICNNKNGCLYDTSSGKLYELDERYTDTVKKILGNQKLDINDEVLNEFVELNLGHYTDSPVYHENSIVDYNSVFNTFNTSNTLDEVYIQVSNICNNSCELCDRTYTIFSKSHCKLWPTTGEPISSTLWEDFFVEIGGLGAQRVIFIGGNPFLKISEMVEIIKLAQKNGINDFEVYANIEYLSQEIIDLCKKYNIGVNVQLVNFDETTICNITELIRSRIKIKVSILDGWNYKISVEDIVNFLQSQGIAEIIVSDLYIGKDEKDCFEKKISGRVSEEKIQIHGILNSCLYGKIYVSNSGDVMPCPMMQTEKLGSLKDQRIVDILKSEKYQKLITASRDKIEGCQKCVFRYNCVDCRAIEFQGSGNLFGGCFCSKLGVRDGSK